MPVPIPVDLKAHVLDGDSAYGPNKGRGKGARKVVGKAQEPCEGLAAAGNRGRLTPVTVGGVCENGLDEPRHIGNAHLGSDLVTVLVALQRLAGRIGHPMALQVYAVALRHQPFGKLAQSRLLTVRMEEAEKHLPGVEIATVWHNVSTGEDAPVKEVAARDL
jgi:hypothetical protein